MPKLSEIISAASGIEPLTLAILFIGLMGLGAIGLAAIAIKNSAGNKKK